MAITAKDVKTLRDRTNAPMMECKAALGEAGGDIEAAIKILKERGIAKAAKRADRDTAEGLVRIAVGEGNQGAVAVEVTCETDFSARNDAFVKLADTVLATAQASSGGVDELMAATVAGGSGSIEDLLNDVKNSIRENMGIRSVHRFEGTCGNYVHFDGKSGAVVTAKVGDDAKARSDEIARILRDVAMHIVAAVPAPVALTAEEIPAELVEQEREIFVKQAVESGKPQEIAEKMVTGRMKKFTAERALVDQAFVKDPGRSVSQVVADAAKELGSEVELTSFVRFQIGG